MHKGQLPPPKYSIMNVKGFSVEEVTGVSDEAVMAGTAYDYNGSGNNAVVFAHMLVGSSAGLIDRKLYDDPDYIDMRAVDIVPDGNGDYFITVLADLMAAVPLQLVI